MSDVESALTILADAAATFNQRRDARVVVHQALMQTAERHFMQDRSEAFERCYVAIATELRNINVPLLPASLRRIREALDLPLAP